MAILKNINYPMNIKNLDIAQLKELADDARKLIINSVVQNGGHLSANLGVVELTIAIHYIFDIPKDKLVFDVGHQCYTHKILTGRKDDFDKLRKKDGISGFPKMQESIFDTANTGHASTSLALTNGIAAAQATDEKSKIITVVGDGALTGGLSFEAINNFFECGSNNRIIILNDNDMSISKNVGLVDKFLKNVRHGGDTTFFEKFGIEYYGTVDGHDFEKLIKALAYAKKSQHSIFVHVITKKGKGYDAAEKSPMAYHGFPIAKINPVCFSHIFGEKLVELAEKNDKIVAVTAAMEDGTGLSAFAEKFPSKFYDVGIAEGYAATFCAGLALGGKKPYFAVYSTFLQRAFDNILHDICLNHLPVTICVDRSGFVAYDGETHQGIYDISFLRGLPNINIICPMDIAEMKKMLDFSLDFNAPLVIKYPKGYINYDYSALVCQNEKFSLGQWRNLTPDNKSDIYLLATGAEMVSQAMRACDILAEESGIVVNVINANSIKPLDTDFLDKLAHKYIITLEDNVVAGGFGSAVVEYFTSKHRMPKIYLKGVSDGICCQATKNELLASAELDAKSIVEFVKTLIKKS